MPTMQELKAMRDAAAAAALKDPMEVARKMAVARSLISRPTLEPNLPPPPTEEEMAAAPGGFMMGLRTPVDAAVQMADEAGIGFQGRSQEIARQQAAYQAARAARGETGTDWARLGGAAVPAVGAAIGATLAAPVVGTGAAIGLGALSGGALGALGATAKPGGDFWEQKGSQAIEGAMLGGVTGGIGRGVGRMGENIARPDIQRMRELGIEPTTGQYFGGMAGKIEERLASIPFAGDMVSSARGRTVEQMNQAMMNRGLAPIGATVTRAGREGIDEGRQAISLAYDEAASMVPGVKIARQDRDAFNNVLSLAAGAPKQVEDNLRRFYKNNLQRRLGNSQGFEPTTFKELEADLNNAIAGATHPLEQRGFMEFKRVLQSAAEREHPAYAEALARANKANALFQTVEDASTRSAVNEGAFSPGQLLMASRQGERTKHGFARGRGRMQDDAEVLQRVMGNTVPNSGTTDRALASSMVLGAPAAVFGGVPGAIGAGALFGAYTAPGQQLINAMLRGGAGGMRAVGKMTPAASQAAAVLSPYLNEQY